MNIHKKMAAILKEFPAVTKDNENQAQRYKYRGIDDGLRVLHPLLAKHGVYTTLVDLQPEFSDAGQTRNGAAQVRCVVTGKVRFYDGEDGSYVEVALIGEGIDMGDKAMMKAQANGLKYVIWYTFAVPTDEPKDSEAFPDPENNKAPARTRKAATSVKNPVVAEIEALTDAKKFGELRDKARTELVRLPGDSPDREALTAAIKKKAAELGIDLNPQRANAVA